MSGLASSISWLAKSVLLHIDRVLVDMIDGRWLWCFLVVVSLHLDLLVGEVDLPCKFWISANACFSLLAFFRFNLSFICFDNVCWLILEIEAVCVIMVCCLRIVFLVCKILHIL